MRKMPTAYVAAILLILTSDIVVRAQGAQSANRISFFITSAGTGKGADLGGLAGADQHCQALAQAAGAGGDP